MIVVNATIVADEAAIKALQPAIEKMEIASRAEAGCEDYTFSVALNDPTVLRITERWKSADDLKAHFLEPHMAEFQAAMGAHPPKSVTALCYDAKEIPLPQP